MQKYWKLPRFLFTNNLIVEDVNPEAENAASFFLFLIMEEEERQKKKEEAKC